MGACGSSSAQPGSGDGTESTPGPSSATSETTPASGPSSGSTSGPGSHSGTATAADTTSGDGALRCNGWAALCERRYDEVVYPAAHNANASRAWGYAPINANHDSAMDVMLEAGMRALLIDVHEFRGQTAMCHGPCGLGNTPHIEGLELIRDFLASHPHDVLTIIYQDEVGTEAIVADFEAAGLLDSVHTQTRGRPWPTLREMIEQDRRLVVTAESGRPPPLWYHHVWDVASDTPFTFFSPDEMSCELNRGQPDNPLFLMNHWVNTRANLPSEAMATVVNAPAFVVERAQRCTKERGRPPTFIAVDFFEQGDVFEAVQQLNGL